MRSKTERMQCSLTIDAFNSNVLLIKPNDKMGFKTDSIYEFNLPEIRSIDGDTIEKQKIKYVTIPSIAYASIDDIKYKLGDIDIKDELIVYHLKEASRLAEVLTAKAFENHNLSFTKDDLQALRNDFEAIKNEKDVIWRLVVYKTTYEVLSSLYVTMLTKPNKIKEVLSDLQSEIQFDLTAIKNHLNSIKTDYDDEVKKIGSDINMTSALRGRTSIPMNVLPGAPYHTPLGTEGYGRNYVSRSNGYLSRR